MGSTGRLHPHMCPEGELLSAAGEFRPPWRWGKPKRDPSGRLCFPKRNLLGLVALGIQGTVALVGLQPMRRGQARPLLPWPLLPPPHTNKRAKLQEIYSGRPGAGWAAGEISLNSALTTFHFIPHQLYSILRISVHGWLPAQGKTQPCK